jgi:cellulose synthase/poly-beta-1,6-N-acetylglucosamine synthase-like glycosyltransferase
MSSEQVIFWAAIVLLGYTYVGYPVLLRVGVALRAREPRTGGLESTVSVVIVAYNEAARIREKLKNLLALDYPSDRLEIVLASDGSTDGTAERARRYRNAGVTVVAFKARRGKSAVLNDLIPKACGEIVVLADARQRFEAGALRALVAGFADPDVGAVSGELILTDGAGSAVGEGVGFYWRYEKFIRRNESGIDSTVGATGAIYAIRRALFEPIPEDTLLDDVLIPMRIARQGYRVTFEPGARAYDRTSATANAEFERKVRTLAGNFQLFARERWLLNPFSNRLWLQTISHKGCRLLSPLCLGVALAANLFLLGQPFYRWMIAAQAVFYAAAAGGYLLRNAAKKHFFLNVPYTFCLLNWAVVTGFFRLVNGRQRVTWGRADNYRDVTLRRGR